ncbi:MAG: NADAR family protein [Bacteroidetes bacterium]|nr:NADAR family protein [Bacteroidota bacterium]
MDTPQNKRLHSDLSPSSDSENQETKRVVYSPLLAFHNKMSDQNQETASLQLIESTDETFKDAPAWGKAMNTNINILNIHSKANEENVQTHTTAVNDLTTQMALVLETVSNLEGRVTDLETENATLRKRVTSIEDYSRKHNLKFDGIVEPETENKALLRDAIFAFFTNKLGIENAKTIKLNNFHRIGMRPKHSTKGRTILIQFLSKEDRDLVWSKKTKLAGSTFFISEHFSETTEQNRKIMLPYVKAARIVQEKHVFTGDKLKIGGKAYSTANLFEIPSNISPEDTATITNENTVIFHGKDSFLSNWYQTSFKSEGQEFSSTEQYYFLKLAQHFNDLDTAENIKAESKPDVIKRMGKKIKNFKANEADTVSRKFLLEANVMKFQQNKDILDKLLATKNKRLGEATKDKKWGIGLNPWDKNALSISHWVGQNRQGGILEEVREILKNLVRIVLNCDNNLT